MKCPNWEHIEVGTNQLMDDRVHVKAPVVKGKFLFASGTTHVRVATCMGKWGKRDGKI
jgi:hypothetical protein